MFYLSPTPDHIVRDTYPFTKGASFVFSSVANPCHVAVFPFRPRQFRPAFGTENMVLVWIILDGKLWNCVNRLFLLMIPSPSLFFDVSE